MDSHFNCLGFHINNQYELSDLISETAKNSELLPTPSGGYFPWRFGNGIELWAPVDERGRLRGLHPHFSGKTSQIAGLSRKFPNPECPQIGAFEAWANPEIDTDFSPPEVDGDYPFVFECPAFDWFQNLHLPVVARIQLAAFAYEIDVQNDDENFRPIDLGPAVLGREFFIPSGTFREVEGKDPQATVFFGGTVLSSKTRTNMLTKKAFTLATIRTYSMNIDILVPENLIASPLLPGQIVMGNFWLSGTIEEILESVEAQGPIDRNRLFFQTEIVGTRYQNIEDLAKRLTFGDRLLLIREPENSHDRNAIQVCTIDHIKLGYIPRIQNYSLAKIMDHGIQPVAHLVDKYADPYYRLIIRVYLPSEKTGACGRV